MPLAVLAGLLSVATLPAQDNHPLSAPRMGPEIPQMGSMGPPREPIREEQLRRMQKQRSTDRHKQIKKDTDELLALATQLKEYVDKTNENILSVDVIRKAEQIEKLAKNVRSKMQDTVSAPDIH